MREGPFKRNIINDYIDFWDLQYDLKLNSIYSSGDTIFKKDGEMESMIGIDGLYLYYLKQSYQELFHEHLIETIPLITIHVCRETYTITKHEYQKRLNGALRQDKDIMDQIKLDIYRPTIKKDIDVLVEHIKKAL